MASFDIERCHVDVGAIRCEHSEGCGCLCGSMENGWGLASVGNDLPEIDSEFRDVDRILAQTTLGSLKIRGAQEPVNVTEFEEGQDGLLWTQ
jgi:hypothetical protein